MVKLMRVDSRLLHGQEAVTWVNHVAAGSILIADDEVMSNEMAKLALKMAKPADCKLAIRSIDGGAELLRDPRTKDMSIFVIVRTIKDAIRLAEQTDCIRHVNIGGVKKKENSKMVSNGVYLNNEDLADLKKLGELVEEVEFRLVPSDPKHSAKNLI